MRLSGRSLSIALFTAVLLIVHLWGGDPLGSWRLPALCWLAGLVWEWRRSRGARLELEVAPAGHLLLGEPGTLEVHYRQQGGGPLRLRHRLLTPAALEPEAVDLRIDLEGNGSVQRSWTVTPVQLGVHTLPDQPLELRGELGLAHWVRRIPAPATLAVQPVFLDTRDRLQGLSLGERRRRPRTGLGGEVLGLRDYRDGDPAARIDWKATARRRAPVVREFEESQQLEMVIVVDAGLGAGVRAGSLTRYGHCCNVAARLAEQARRQGDQVGLLLFADRVLHRVRPGRALSHHAGLRRCLAEHDARERESNPLQAMLAVRQLVRHRALVVVFTDLDDPDAAGQLLAATALLRPVHLPLVAAVRDPELDAISQGRPRDWRDPWNAIAATEMQRQLRTTRARLRRLGAEVVHATPERLDEAVRRRYTELRNRRLV